MSALAAPQLQHFADLRVEVGKPLEIGAVGHGVRRLIPIIGGTCRARGWSARVLPGGTAYMTDVGMTGPRDSVIGVSTSVILRRFTTELPQQFEVAEGPVRLDAALISSDGGRATAIEAVDVIL